MANTAVWHTKPSQNTDQIETEVETDLNVFSGLKKNDPAPYWLFNGVCAAWGLEHELTDLILITVSENATFRLDVAKRPVGVIRVSQPGYVGGTKAIVSEFSWLGALHSLTEVKLIDPVATITGNFVAQIRDNKNNTWSCVSTSFVPGEVLEDLPNPAPHYETIGYWTALFHNQARDWQEPPDFKRFTWDITDQVGPHCRWGQWEDAVNTDDEYDLLKTAEEKAIKLAESFPRTAQTWGLIHADLRPSNILAAPDGQLTIIDFDDCGYGWFLYDFAAALSFVEHKPYAKQMASLWLAGYQRVTPLTPADITQACALSMLRRLTMLGWTVNHRSDALPEGLFDEQLPGTLEVATNFLADTIWIVK